MKKLFTIAILLFVVNNYILAQHLGSKSKKGFYLMYGHHLKTKYISESGQGGLVGRKNVFSTEIGFLFERKISMDLAFRTGISGHLLFLSETTYGIAGLIPPQLASWSNIKYYKKGIEYIETVSFGVPFKLSKNIKISENYDMQILTGPFIGFYTPNTDEVSGSDALLDNGTILTKYNIDRHFADYKLSKKINISGPLFEWESELELIRHLMKYRELIFGFKFHNGTKKLESAKYEIFPSEPGYKSTGKFTLNRSYIGIYGAFTFGKHK